jgi:creatinine amidohydrolase
MTWPELAETELSRSLALCCLAATEQHSLHLPFATDRLIGDEIVRRVEREAPQQVLLLPTVWLGCSDHHLAFPGTLSASVLNMRGVIHDLVRSVESAGIRKVLFLNSHGGNQAILTAAIQELATSHSSMTVVGGSYWSLASEALAAIRESEFGGMGHACELETSILLAIAPQWVRQHRFERDGIIAGAAALRGEMLAAPRAAVNRGMAAMSVHGGYGDPGSATADKGERFLRAIVEAVLRLAMDLLEDRV